MPHAYPFRLVERAEAGERGRVGIVMATANGSLASTGPWPVTLVAEALAQAILLVVDPLEKAALRLVALDGVRVLQPIGPASRLEVEVDEVAAYPPLRRYSCRALQGGALAATAEITVSG